MQRTESKVNVRTFLSSCCLLLGLILFAVATANLAVYIRDGKTSDAGNARAAAMVKREVTVNDLTEASGKVLPEDEMDITAMKEVNPDTIGYLKVQGKEFPVVRGEDNSKYLKTGWDGKKTCYGCIFMDAYCGLNGKNIILYGHHMKSGKMFGTLNKYTSKEYLNEYPTFKWITEDSVDTYTIVAVIIAKASDISDVLDMDLKSDFDTLSEKARKNGTLYQELYTGKSYMSLVTCEYTVKDGRLVVIGERTEHLARNTESAAEP